MDTLPDCVVPDSSVIVDGRISTIISDDDASTTKTPNVIISEAVVSELESQANKDNTSGWDGLSELQRLAEMDDENIIEVTYSGDDVRPSDIDGAEQGDIDSVIRQLADEHDATLLTSDTVQAETARAHSISTELIEPEIPSDSFAIESFFDEGTMSVHLKTDTLPKAKKGALEDIDYVAIDDTPTSIEQMREWATEIENVAHTSPDGFIELSEDGMEIIQLRDYRIAIAQPPFSDGIEITAVKPVAKTTIGDYDVPDELLDRFTTQQSGVLIAGAPGAGKSTFAQAVGEYLNDQGVVVKTMEKPRDLQVGPEITQYTALSGEMEKTADSLLLVRPDYTIYDEVRKTDDFDVFSDMRLAGVGMVGVVHANRAIDALQRLVGRVELGLIPQIVDTIVYIDSGGVHTIYDITTEVKMPDGMNSEDLARPVIQVQKYGSDQPEFEIYTFNGQVNTVELDEDSENPSGPQQQKLSKEDLKTEILHAIKSVADKKVDVEMGNNRSATVYVDKNDIAQVIGEGGTQITAIENRLNVTLDVCPSHEKGI